MIPQTPPVLRGRRVRLEPLTREHIPDLVSIGLDPDFWPWQRTFVNTETKYLMLRYAFDEMQCVRVELKTDRLNERSRNAILRIGAVEEGILRSHFITASGRLRDTVYFSILASEWPDVRRRLEAKLDDLVAADGAS